MSAKDKSLYAHMNNKRKMKKKKKDKSCSKELDLMNIQGVLHINVSIYF
jgi:hypothetical protein